MKLYAEKPITGVVAHNISDDELVRLAESQFANPTPLMQALIDRLAKRAVTPTPVENEEPEEELDPTTPIELNCPCCGSNLILQPG